MNPKTVTTLFRLDNEQANEVLKIKIENKTLAIESYPKYFAVSLNRILSNKKHLKIIAQKLKSCISILKKLTGTNWDAYQTVLRSSVLALCYSTAEYSASVWEHSTYAKI